MKILLAKPMEVCKHCGKEFIGDTYRKRQYCSHKCYWKARSKYSGEKNPNWKGGRVIDGQGYVLIRVSNGRRIREHRFIMEKKLGRHLKPEELIHHINEDRADNRLKNLQVMTIAEHRKIHAKNITV